MWRTPAYVLTDGVRQMAADRNRTYQGIIILVLSTNFGIVFFERSTISYLMPFIKPELRLNNLQVGALSSTLAITWALSGLLVGGVSDRLQKRKALIVACDVVFSCASVLSSFAAGFASLLAARLVMGASEGGIMPLSQTLIAADVNPQRRALAMGIVQNLGSNLIAHFMGPIILIAAGSAIGWRNAVLFAAAPGLIMALIVQLFVRESRSPDPRIHKTNSTFEFGKIMRNRNIALCLAIVCLLLATFSIYSTFMPLILISLPGMDARHASWVLGVVGLSAAISAVLVTSAADLMGRRPVAIVGSMLGLFLPVSVLLGGGIWQIMTLVAIGSSCSAIIPIVMSTIPSETVSPNLLAATIGLIMGVGEMVGSVLTPLIAGEIADNLGLRSLLWGMAAFCLLAALLAVALRETSPSRSRSGESLLRG